MIWRPAVAVALVFGFTFGSSRAAHAQQMADTTFDLSVSRPAHTARRPFLVIDEAHSNFHKASGRYSPFATLMQNDGLRIGTNTSVFSDSALRGIDILVIANAASPGSGEGVRRSGPAFTAAECDAVRDWVRAGGALLLISDHAPFGGAAEGLAQRFGVDFGKGYVSDTLHSLSASEKTVLVFEKERLGSHPIVRGRNSSERIQRVVAFTGQSMSIPTGGAALLRLSAFAMETPRPPEVDTSRSVSAAGRAQAVAMPFGRGRVVMLGEAAMMTAQVAGGAVGRDGLPFTMGMNRPGSDDKQFALNVVRWLSRALR
ncbi:MAG: DUF4350 domain-containing protein [Gemmatimonadales bacterium]|nr:DUF4350 domain-containing protein [Gemmatimonadales bacterium]